MSALEGRYRRLLLAYPRTHRTLYQEEMLGVLLAAARPDQRRPSVPDVLDLAHGALRAWIRDIGRPRSGQWWDALAVVSLLAPVLLGLRAAYELAVLFADAVPLAGEIYQILVWLGWPVALALMLLRRFRRSAAAVAWVATAWPALYVMPPEAAEWLVLGVLAAAGLTWSPGPARGLDLLGRSRFAVFVAGALALGLSLAVAHRPDMVGPDDAAVIGWTSWSLFGIGTAMVIGAGARLGTTTGRLTVLLLGWPTAAILAELFRLVQQTTTTALPTNTESSTGRLQVLSAVLLAAAVVAGLLSLRDRRRESASSDRPRTLPT